MNKRWLSLALAIAMVVSMLPANVFATEMEEAAEVMAEATIPTVVLETIPAIEPETEPTTEAVTEPETEPVTEPVTEPETEPETEPATEAVTEPELPTEVEPEVEENTAAEDTTPAMELNAPIALAPGGEETRQFTVPETGEYVLWKGQQGGTSANAVSGASWSFCDSEGNCHFTAEQNAVVALHLRNASSVSVAFGVERCVPVEGLTLTSHEASYLVGNTYRLGYTASPRNYVAQGLELSSSNPAVAECVTGGFRTLSAGITTIAITASNGVSALCEITVVDAPPAETIEKTDESATTPTEESATTPTEESVTTLALGETVFIPSTGTFSYSFTPEEEGEYCILRDDSINISLNCDDVSVGREGYHVRLKAGSTLVLTAYSYMGEAGRISVQKCVPIQSVSISSFNQTMFVGESVWLTASFTPSNYICEDYTWSSSNPEVARMENNHLIAVSAGEAIISVTTKSGVSDSWTVTVEEPKRISVGETVSVPTFETVAYSFTPEEEGEYCFLREGVNFDYNGKYNWASWDGEGNLHVALSAGSTFILSASTYSAEEGSITLEKCVPAQSVYIKPINQVMYVGDVRWLRVSSKPSNFIFESYTWSSSNPAVARIDGNNLHAVATGETTITVTTENGLTDSLLVTVLSPNVISTDETVTIPAGKSISYHFTPEESGEYCFMPSAYASLSLSGSFISSKQVKQDCHVMMTAGDTCTVTIDNYQPQSITFTVKKCVDVKSISVELYHSAIFTGDRFAMTLSASPRNFDYSSITWTSSNPEVARCSGNVIEALSGGETTITAAAPNGVSGSKTITVKSVEDISLGFEAELRGSASGGAEYCYHFTAPSSGKFIFHEKSNQSYSGSINVTDNRGYYGSGQSVAFDAVEGTTYTIQLSLYGTEVHTFCLEEAGELEGILSRVQQISGYVGTTSYVDFQLKPVPNNGALEGLTFSIADEKIAQLDFITANGGTLRFLQPGSTELTVEAKNGVRLVIPVVSTNPEAIQLGQGKQFTASYNQLAYFQFTAPETGDYILRVERDANSEITVLVRNGDNYVGSCYYGRGQVHLEAGESCTISVGGSRNTLRTDTLHVEMGAPAEALQLNFAEINKPVGSSVELKPILSPTNAIQQKITWENSDPTVAELIQHSGSDTVSLELLKAGTTVITATMGNLSASCTVTATELEQIAPGFSRKLTLAMEDYYGFLFTAPKDGSYRFWGESSNYDSGTISHSISIYDVTDGGTRLSGETTGFAAIEGHVYRIGVNSIMADGSAMKATYHLEECVPLQSLGLTYNGSYSVDDVIYVGYQLTPENVNERFSLCIEGDCLEVRYTDILFCNLYAVKAGTATLTVTASNGVSASATFQISESKQLTLDKPVTLETGSQFLSFQPEEDGDYCLLIDENAFCNTSLSGSYYYSERGKNEIYFGAGPGMHTNFQVELFNPESCTAVVEKCVPLEGITITNVNTYLSVGEKLYPRVIHTPRNGAHEEITWTSSDPAVLEPAGTGYFKAVAEGDVTLTATSASGKTHSLQIHVSGSTPITLGNPATVGVNAMETFSFTAPASGEYCFMTDEDLWANTYVKGSWEYRGWANNAYYFRMDEGETCLFRVENKSQQPVTAAVEECVPLESIILTINRTLVVGEEFYPSYVLSPRNSIWENPVVSFTNPDDVEVLQPGQYDSLIAVGEGQATVTVTTDSGKSDSVEICVVAMAAPANFTARMSAPNTVILNWSPVEAAEGYDIYRQTDGGKFYFIKSVTGNEAYNYNLTLGKTYGFKIAAYVVEDGVKVLSGYSEVQEVTILKAGTPLLKSVVQSAPKTALIKWSTVGSVSGYELYRSREENGKYALMKSLSENVTSNYNLTEGVTYYYKVRAYVEDSSGTREYGEFSNSIPVAIHEIAAVQMKSAAQNGNTTAMLKWSTVKNANGYELWCSVGKNPEFTLLRDFNKTGTAMQVSKLESGETYRFKMRAYQNTQEGKLYGNFSEVISLTILATPVLEKAEQDGAGCVRLVWNAIDGAEGYRVVVSSSNGILKELDVPDANTVIGELEVGTTYTFKVCAYTSNGMGKSYGRYSAAKSVEVKIAPTVTKLMQNGPSSVNIYWDDIGTEQYELYRATEADGVFTRVKSVTGTETRNYSLTEGGTYYYKLRGFDIVNGKRVYTAFSSVAKIALLKTPVITGAVRKSNSCQLTWDAVEGAEGYRLYRSTSESGGFTLVKTITGTSTTTYSLDAETTYYFRVKAIKKVDGATQDSGYSNIMEAAAP